MSDSSSETEPSEVKVDEKLEEPEVDTQSVSGSHSNVGNLIDAVNMASGTARRGWVFFLLILTYLFVAVASVSHADLLLNSPIRLPLLNVDVTLTRFFYIAPLFVLFLYLGLMLQHAALADKTRALVEILSDKNQSQPDREPVESRRHLEASTYFVTEALVGMELSWFRRFLLGCVIYATIGLLPVLLLLFFQTAFLPFHDISATMLH